MNLFYVPSVICLVFVSLISMPNKGLSMENPNGKLLYNKVHSLQTYISVWKRSTTLLQLSSGMEDGLRDSYTRDQTRISQARNVGYYKDPRGGEWQLIGYAGSFSWLIQNKNTIIYDMTIEDCRKTPWDYLCPN